jgi:hypothetical protein
MAAAREFWTASLAAEESPWALRNLAIMNADEGQLDVAADQLLVAASMAPRVRPLAIEAAEALLVANRPQELLDFIGRLSADLQTSGRLLLAQAKAALGLGDLDRVGALVESGIEIADIREGESALHELWQDYQAYRLAASLGTSVNAVIRERAEAANPVPLIYDFRMKATTSGSSSTACG